MAVLVKDGGWGGLERIEIDVDNPEEVTSTCEFFEDGYWRDGEFVWMEYAVSTEVEKVSESIVKYHIHYSEEGMKTWSSV